jgi:DNA-binding NarL/FixJ family response regulator
MLKVMLMDNTPQCASELRQALARAGFEVTATVESALELNEQMARVRLDLIIIDTDSPTRDGADGQIRPDSKRRHGIRDEARYLCRAAEHRP